MLPLAWGATPDEHARPYPADTLVDRPLLLTRAVDVAAPVPLTWRWLCQVAVAPYSYDWIDNGGRGSPRELTRGADELVLGQAMAKVFTLTSYDVAHQWTALTDARGRRLFGPCAMTFAAEPSGADSRIVCRLAVAAGSPLERVRAQALAWGDLVMMRKQLHTLKELAERDARRQAGSSPAS
ncbi:hypothetical protein [Nocardioides sp. W7]|uniref:hypothetical protein n=1 Tax=Nocardioides sp. W7 TaxID=2931390 RepID=UPI001FD17096|nr:hypothetical protein [Nocardioides sp. W7]